MTTYVEALDAALSRRYRITEVRSPATTKRGVQARLSALERLHGGSGAQAAAAANIPKATWNHWKAGRPLSPKSVRRLEGAYARQIIRPQALRKLATTPPPAAVAIHAIVVGDPGTTAKPGNRYTNSTPVRWFRPENLRLGRVVQAWLHLGAAAAADVLDEEISLHYPTSFGFEGDVQVVIT